MDVRCSEYLSCQNTRYPGQQGSSSFFDFPSQTFDQGKFAQSSAKNISLVSKSMILELTLKADKWREMREED
jgi:hypothetical protein